MEAVPRAPVQVLHPVRLRSGQLEDSGHTGARVAGRWSSRGRARHIHSPGTRHRVSVGPLGRATIACGASRRRTSPLSGGRGAERCSHRLSRHGCLHGMRQSPPRRSPLRRATPSTPPRSSGHPRHSQRWREPVARIAAAAIEGRAMRSARSTGLLRHHRTSGRRDTDAGCPQRQGRPGRRGFAGEGTQPQGPARWEGREPATGSSGSARLPS